MKKLRLELGLNFKIVIMKNVFLLMLLFMTSGSVFSQGDEALEVVKRYTAVQREDIDVKAFASDYSSGVNNYNGEYNFSLNLASIQGVQVKCDLNLSYSSGVKVSDRAGVVGFGWNLGSVGSISRQINGISDFYNDGFSKGILAFSSYSSGGLVNIPTQVYSEGEVPYPCPMLQFEHPYGVAPYTGSVSMDEYFVSSKTIDLERDIYTLNVPGFACHFYFENNETIKIIENVDFRLVQMPTCEGYNNEGSSNWIIQLDNGLKYYFGTTRESRSYIQNFSFQMYSLNFPQVLAWNLVKIEAPGGEEIEFIYSLDQISENITQGNTNAALSSSGSYIDSFNGVDSYHSGSSYFQEYSRLNEAVYSINDVAIEKLVLEYSNERLDGDYPSRLNTVIKKVRNNSLDFSEMYTMEFDYEALSNRLWLKGINRKSSRSVDYPAYLFQYDDLNNYPDLESHARDFHGFYNGAVENISLISKYDLSGSLISSMMNLNGTTSADRRIHPEFLQKGNLTKINTPLGAEVSIEYEAGYENIGIRVKRLDLCDSDLNKCRVSNFIYDTELNSGTSSGKVMRGLNFDIQTCNMGLISNNTGGLTIDTYLSLMYSASPLNGLSASAAGKEVGYSTVFVTYGELGEEGLEKYEFLNTIDQPCFYTSSGFEYVSGADIRPLHKIPFKTNENINGKLLKKTVYKKNEQQEFVPSLIVENLYKYKESDNTGSILTNMIGYLVNSPNYGYGCESSGAIAQFCNCLHYEQQFKSCYISETRTTFIDNELNELQTSEKYIYNTNNKLNSKTFYKDDQLVQEISYSYYPSAPIIGEMTSWNLADDYKILLASKRIVRNGQTIGGERIEYQANGLPKAVYTYNSDYEDNGFYEKTISYVYESVFPIEIYKQGLPVESKRMAGNDLIAKIIGCKVGETYIENFDQIDEENPEEYSIESPYLGDGCLEISSVKNFRVPHTKWNEIYRIQFAYMTTQYIQLGYKIVDEANDNMVYSQVVIDAISPSNEWMIYSTLIDLENVDMVGKQLIVYVLNSSNGTPINIDEMRVYPNSASVESYNYNDVNLITSKLDWNFRKESYEYDDFDNLSLTRDFEGHILNRTLLNYKLGN